MTCIKCSALPVQDPSFDGSIQHYSTFAELSDSVQNGCQICELFMKALLEYSAHQLSSSIQEAEIYQRQLDQELESNIDDNHDLQGEQGDRDRESTAFFTEFRHLPIDSNFATHSGGLHGILYVRKYCNYSEEEDDVVDALYPFVEVSSSPSRQTSELHSRTSF